MQITNEQYEIRVRINYFVHVTKVIRFAPFSTTRAGTHLFHSTRQLTCVTSNATVATYPVCKPLRTAVSRDGCLWRPLAKPCHLATLRGHPLSATTYVTH